MNSRDSILIILVAGIGDLVMSSNSLKALRNGFPNADIHLLTSSDAAALAKNYTYVDKVWEFPIREFRTNRIYILNMLKIALKLRKIKFLTAINLYKVDTWAGALKIALLFSVIKPKIKIGHNHKVLHLILNKSVPADTFDNRHFSDAMMKIAELAGGKPIRKDLEVFWEEGTEKKWENLFLNDQAKDKVNIGINPGGDRENRRWDPENYATVADQLINRYAAQIFIFGGPGEEDIAKKIQKFMKGESINLAGKLNLNDLVFIISRLDLLVTNDSGPMHIASAVKTPLVAIFGPENPVIVKPYTSRNFYRIAYKDNIDCRPCNKKDCSHPTCLEMITPEEIFDKSIELLSSFTNE